MCGSFRVASSPPRTGRQFPYPSFSGPPYFECMEPGELDEAELADLHRLASTAARQAGAGDDAADVAQETLIKLDTQGSFEALEPIKAWVQRTARNATVDLHRQREHIAGEADDADRPPIPSRAIWSPRRRSTISSTSSRASKNESSDSPTSTVCQPTKSVTSSA